MVILVRDMVILVRPETGDCVNLLSLPNSIRYPGHFLSRVFNSRHDVHSASWRRYVTGSPFYFFMLINYNISESIQKSAKRGHCTRAEQECRTMTD